MTEKKFDIDGVIFDLGSTLLEYETIPWDELNKKCMEAGYRFLIEEGYAVPTREKFWEKQLEIRTRYRDKAAKTLKEWSLRDALHELLGAVQIDGGDSLADRFFEAFYKPVSRQLTLFADTHSVLAKIKNAGKKIGLVSNTIFPEEYHRNELKKYGLAEYFDFEIFSVTFGYRKPHPLIYRRAVELAGIVPEKLLFVGDRFIEDYQGPVDNGLNAVLKYREGREYPEPLPKSIPIVNSLTELLPYIIE